MATPAHRSDNPPVALLERGLEFHAREQYGPAEKLIIKAMDLCKCRAIVQKQPSISDDIMKGIAKDNLKGVLVKLSASSRRCDNRTHLDALDALIAIYETRGYLDDCLELAVKMINLCPREPKAYLRLGKILRLKQNPTLAYLNYKQGTELVKRKQPNRIGLISLCEQRDKVKPLAKFDPMATFPIELVRMIFKLAGFKSQCRSLQVSKGWKAALTSDDAADLWQVQTFQIKRRYLGFMSLKNSFIAYYKYARHTVKEVSIDGCHTFDQMSKFFNYQLARVYLSPEINILKIRRPQHPFELGMLPQMPKLRTLYLGMEVRPDLLHLILQGCLGSLEELSIFNVPFFPGWCTSLPAKLEKLKVVRLQRPKLPDSVPYFSIENVVVVAPNVEEAWLNGFLYYPGEHLSWTKLRYLFVGQAYERCYREERQVSFSFGDIHYPPDMRELHLEGQDIVQSFANGKNLKPRPADDPYFRSLEKLSLFLGDCEAGCHIIQDLIQPGLESGTLRELDVRPLPVNLVLVPSTLPGDPRLRVADWFRSESLEYMSLTGFQFAGIDVNTRHFDETMLEIVDRFPNLRRVDIGTEPFSDSLLAKFIQRGVKHIHHRAGAQKSDLREWAAKNYGAEVVSRPPLHLPSLHPERTTVERNYLAYTSEAKFNYSSEG